MIEERARPFFHVDPPSAAYDGSEIAIQTLFRSRARIMCPAVALVAVPNGTYIASRAGRAKAQREGLSAGFPDIAAFWPGGGTALLEFKAKNGRISEQQQMWMERLVSFNLLAGVFRHPDTALDALRRWGAPFIDREGCL